MSDLSGFPITRRWPAENPEILQLYSLPTPNGVKASIMLEETGLPYEAHLVSFGTDDQMTPEFLSLNPNNKIPTDRAANRWACGKAARFWCIWRKRPAGFCPPIRRRAMNACNG